MKQKRTFVTLLLVIALLCLGIGYAAISGVTLNINGSASAMVGEGTIDVIFKSAKNTAKPDGAEATATIEADDDKTATINVSQLTAAGQTATFELVIENQTTDIAATLGEPDISWTNTEWFDVDCTLSGTELGVYDADADTTDTQTATVTVTLLKTPVTEGEDGDEGAAKAEDITITIAAEPVENK